MKPSSDNLPARHRHRDIDCRSFRRMTAAWFSRAETIRLGRQSCRQLRSLSRPARTRRGKRGVAGAEQGGENPSGDFTGNYAASPWTGAGGLLLFNANVGARRTPRRPPAPIARPPDRHPICAKLSMIEWHERSKTPAFSGSHVLAPPAALFSFFFPLSLPPFSLLSSLLFRPKNRPALLLSV